MNNNTNKHLLGILGGLGPMSTAYFYEMITEHTLATCDQDHIDIMISSGSTTPDRTGFILGTVKDDPAIRMISDAKKLVSVGCDVIAIPCNTAHYFYRKVSENVDVPIINIIYETLKYCHDTGTKRIGIMATDGTVSANIYQETAKDMGIECYIPKLENQAKVMDIIYGSVKRGLPVDMNSFYEVVDDLKGKGCDKVVLGCTELSLIKKDYKLDSFYLDALEVLAWRSIKFCEKETIGFEEFENEIRA